MQKIRNKSFNWHFLVAGIIIFSSCKEKDANIAITPIDTSAFLYQLPGYRLTTPNDPSDNHTTNSGVALGRVLFFDATLSGDGKISCGSCHKPESGFSDNARLSTGQFNRLGRRNSMGLSNLRYESFYFWDGRETTLEKQIPHPISDQLEMGLTPLQYEEKLKSKQSYLPYFEKAFGANSVNFQNAVKALAQYVRSLTSYNSPYDKYLMGQQSLTPAEERGKKLFFTHPDASVSLRGGNCGDCHLPISLGGGNSEDLAFKNNGIYSQGSDDGRARVTRNNSDLGKFKIPSLRNVALTAPYMHDGSLQTLQDVLDHYNHPNLFQSPFIDDLILEGKNERFGTSLGLTQSEKEDIIAFLHTLTDSTLKHK